MFLSDHDKLDPPTMLCPFRTGASGNPAKCMGEPCALWYQNTSREYSGCAPFVTAFYSGNTSYNTRCIKDGRRGY